MDDIHWKRTSWGVHALYQGISLEVWESFGDGARWSWAVRDGCGNQRLDYGGCDTPARARVEVEAAGRRAAADAAPGLADKQRRRDELLEAFGL